MTQPTGSGVFFVFYTSAAGQRRKMRLGEYHPDHISLSEARTRAYEAMAAIDRGADPVAVAKAKADAMTFQQLAERFLAEAPHLATKTRRVYRYCLEKDVYPAIGAMPAAEVTPDHVLDICKSIEAREIVTMIDGHNEKRNPRIQSQRTKTTIGGVYRWALKERVGSVKINPSKDVGLRAPKVERTRTPTDDELAKLWAATENETSKLSQSMRLVVQLSILTAQRRDEVAGARFSELRGLDTDAPMWVIPGDVNRRGKIIEGRTKNGREQQVPLSRQAAALFRQAVDLSKDKTYLFPADLSKVKIGREPRTPHINGDSVTMAVRRLRTAAGVADISIHDMRRAISNWLKNQGVSKEVRDLVLNHMDPSVTERHYSATARMEKQVQAALQSWADHVSVVTGQPAQTSNVIPMASARA